MDNDYQLNKYIIMGVLAMKKVKVIIIVFLLGLIFSSCGKKEDLISIKFSSEDLVGGNYETVVKELERQGFINIETSKIEDLITGWLTKDGEVEEVSIDGDVTFLKSAEFPADVPIIVSYHTFKEESTSETKKDVSMETEEPISEEIKELFIMTETEIEANEDNTLEIKGTATPGAIVTTETGIFGGKTTADSEGNFTIKYELITPEKTIITLNTKLEGQKKSIDITILPNPIAVKKYEEEKTKESLEEDKSHKLGEDKSEEIITLQNNEEFAHILKDSNDLKSYANFAKKYEGKQIEFDAHIAYMNIHPNKKTRYDFLIYGGDYSETSGYGVPFQIRDKNVVNDLNLIGDNIPDSISEGLNIRLIAEVVKYDSGSGLLIINPIETRIR